MNIYIDESGTFVNATSIGKWNAVAALAVPESGRRKLEALVSKLKQEYACLGTREVKLNKVPEARYFNFLSELQKLNAVVFCTATDAGRNTTDNIADHQKHQVGGLLKHLSKIKHEGGRQGVELIAAQLTKLPPQLYVQLICQTNLMYNVVSQSITYFAQRAPITLREFRWRIDQKNSKRPDFEEVFERLSPALLQSRSIEEPMMMMRGLNYSHMAKYEFPNGEPPEYLKKDYGIEVKDAFDIQRLIRGNIKFMDSKDSYGIQAIDIVVSGIRRCLRGKFGNNELAAILLGRLMLQAKHNAPVIDLIVFGPEAPLPNETSVLVKLMSSNSRPMLK